MSCACRHAQAVATVSKPSCLPRSVRPYLSTLFPEDASVQVPAKRASGGVCLGPGRRSTSTPPRRSHKQRFACHHRCRVFSQVNSLQIRLGAPEPARLPREPAALAEPSLPRVNTLAHSRRGQASRGDGLPRGSPRRRRGSGVRAVSAHGRRRTAPQSAPAVEAAVAQAAAGRAGPRRAQLRDVLAVAHEQAVAAEDALRAPRPGSRQAPDARRRRSRALLAPRFAGHANAGCACGGYAQTLATRMRQAAGLRAPSRRGGAWGGARAASGTRSTRYGGRASSGGTGGRSAR